MKIQCDVTDLEYPSESKMKCNKCSIGTIPKYDTENSNWICVNCDVSYEENDEIICADELCADDPLTTFDTNLKECTMCPLNSYLDQVSDECKGQHKQITPPSLLEYHSALYCTTLYYIMGCSL